MFQNGSGTNKNPNIGSSLAKISSNEQSLTPDNYRDSKDEYESDGDYKGEHHGPLLLTGEALRNGTAWKGTEAEHSGDSKPTLQLLTSSGASISPLVAYGWHRLKSDRGLVLPQIIVTSPDGIVSPGSWGISSCKATILTSSGDMRLLHVQWKPLKIEEHARHSLQPEQGQYTLATIDSSIARLVMKKRKKKADFKDKGRDYKLSDAEDADIWDD